MAELLQQAAGHQGGFRAACNNAGMTVTSSPLMPAIRDGGYYPH